MNGTMCTINHGSAQKESITTVMHATPELKTEVVNQFYFPAGAVRFVVGSVAIGLILLASLVVVLAVRL